MPLSHLLALLHQATDLKLLRHGGPAALDLLTQADALCDEHPELPRTLRGLAAYRMGHLRMRGAGDRQALELAERDFQRACRLGEGLEPWAQLYHLAVLGRLASRPLEPQSAARIQRRLEQRWAGTLRALQRLDPASAPDRDDPIVQRGSLNAAEALAYALGLELSGLEGLGTLEHALHADADWGFLVGPALDMAHVRLPWSTLPVTLRQLREAQPESLAFLLPPGERRALLWHPGKAEHEPISRQQALLLTWVLRGCPGGRGGLERRVYGRPTAAATRRKLLQRTREALARACGGAADAVILRDDRGRLRQAPGLVVHGAVHGESWRGG